MKEKPDQKSVTFSQLIDGVAPIRSENTYTPPKSSKHKGSSKTFSPETRPKTDPVMWSDECGTVIISEYKRVGVQNRMMRKLKRNQYPITRQVDLHGLTINEARAALQYVLQTAQRDSITAILVIHGKGLNSSQGKSVLKPKVRSWLQQDVRVLAFTDAPPEKGGSGAVYLLLRSALRY